MFIVSRFAAFLSGALLAVAAVGTAHAEYVDPPSRVARLSYVRGEVSFSPGGESDWVAATRNRPLIRGDRLWTDRGALAELQAGNATFRVDEGTSFSILNLSDDTAQVEITQGTLNLRVRRIYDNQVFEVDTPTLAFVVSRPGEYRIDVDPSGNHTTVAVWDGGGEAYGDKANFRIREGEAIRFYDNKLADYEVFDIPRPDEFDRFCQDRDASADRAVSRRYVSEDLIGYSDLDEYGSWSEESDYGAVWYPSRVAADWAPYRDGHWIWQEPWGWTWVDDNAWGFAPFHYGRWAHVRNRWGWIPGPIASRPVYAPALVAFVGGGNFSVGINVGRPIGWFPLGPREVYVPPYRTSRRYFTSVNVTNTTINNVYITNIYDGYSRGRNVTTDIRYVNRGVNGAVTAVSGETFINSRSVRQAQVRLDRDMAVRGETSQVAAIAPVNRSVLGGGAAARAVPQRDVFNRSVVARTAPARDIAPFAERQQALQRTPGRALEPEAISAIQQRDRAAPGRDAGAPQRIRVIDDNAARAARTIDASPGDRGGPQRTRGPESTADAPGRGVPNRDAPAPSRGTPDVARDRGPVERGAPAERAQQPSRDASAPRVDRDFTRPDARQQRDATQRQPISREQFQRDEAQPRDVDQARRVQRDQVQQQQRDQAQQREQVQRDDAQRQQVERQAQQQRNRDQAQREDLQRQRDQDQQREQQQQREQTQRDDSMRRQREDTQREQAQQREQVQRQQREQAQQRDEVQRQQREQAQQREEGQRQQREQAQQREAQQQQARQAQEQQRAVQEQQRAAQQQQREAQQQQRQQREAPPQRKRDDDAKDDNDGRTRRSRDDGDNR